MDTTSPVPSPGRILLGDLAVALVPASTVAVTLALLQLRADASPVGPGSLTLAAMDLVPLSLVASVVLPLVLRAWRWRTAGRLPRSSAVALAVPASATLGVAALEVGRLLDGGVVVGGPTLLTECTVALFASALSVLLVSRALPDAPEDRAGWDRPRARWGRVRTWRLIGSAAVAVTVAGGGILAPSTVAVAGTTALATAQGSGSQQCLAGGAVDRSYDVTALDVDVTINRFGDHDPVGKMYALTTRVPAIRAQEASGTVSVGLGDDPIQPLVIRANEGDCIEVHFTNSATGGEFGMHIDGLEFAVSSSGDRVGRNASSAVAPGGSTTYRYAIPNDPSLEGGHDIHPGPGYRSAVGHGLFGALLVEPPGSTYWDATTPSKPLQSGWEAIIKPAGIEAACVPMHGVATCGFREAALLHHEIGNDNERLFKRSGARIPLVDNLTGTYRPGAFALNYRSEPFRNRLLAFPKEKAHAYSSYTFGEPATPMVRSYLADPTKIRLMHVGAEKFHVFHLHGGGDRWRFNPLADTTFDYATTGLHKDPETTESPSTRLDSQSIGPGESYNLEIEGGGGGAQQSAGDFLYHCHIAKHYNSGMWGLWRVYDTLQPDLVAIADRPAPPAPVDSRGLIGRTVNGTTITADNLDEWVRDQLPPSGIPKDSQDATVWDWKVAGTVDAPLYLGAPADPKNFANSIRKVPGQPNLLPVDVGHIVGNRPAILFNPVNGRPAYPMFRSAIGKRPPFSGAGHTGTPWLGANADQRPKKADDTWADRADGLCPKGRDLRTFNVVTVNKPVRRSPTVVDPLGMLFVLAHDKDALMADPEGGEPLAIRANQGDCIAVTLTNEIPDAAAFDKYSKSSMHIHHVQFDVQGSDGVSAGFAYEHSVRPYKVMDVSLTAPADHGDTVLHLSSVSKLIGTDANGAPTRPWIAVGQGTESIDIHQVLSVDPATSTVTLATGLDKDHAAGEFAGTEFIQYRWYPDVELDNVFWHDHVDGIHGWGHGLVGQLIVEPKGSTYHDPVSGQEVDSGALVDIHTSKALAAGVVPGSFRELALWTLNDNDAAEFSTLNLKAAPLFGRLDKANQFSSWKYGDPGTPLPRLYANDPLVIRAVNVSPTIDTLHVQGGRTLLEPRNTHPGPSGPVSEGTIIDTIHYGASERFSLVFNGDDPELRMRPGDYLYAQGNELRTQQGAWGIVRILPGRVDDLRPLPGVSTTSTPYTVPVSSGGVPPASTGPGNPCPAGAPARRFDVSAMDKSTTLTGGRTAYVPNADVQDVKKGRKDAVPLVLHVVAGECVTVNVTNLLTTPVGFSVAKLDRAAGSGGANVGFSLDQNVAVGATRPYVYYADSDRVGIAAIADLAGIRTKSGLYGAIVVAPASQVVGEDTQFSDPVTGAPRDIGAQVIVHVPGATTPDYRDFTVTLADDDVRMGEDFMPYPTNAIVGKSLLNYRAAPAGDGPTAFLDPGRVPLLTAYAGDPEVVHVMITPGSENSHVFGLGGLPWRVDPLIDGSNVVTAQGMGPWETFSAEVIGGAGATTGGVGDIFYGDVRRPFTAAGVWGLQRVLPAGTAASCPLLLVDGSRCQG